MDLKFPMTVSNQVNEENDDIIIKNNV
jgi:hypothetical protein